MNLRSKIVHQRTYARTNDEGLKETWPQTVGRVIQHQKWLWSRYGFTDEEELRELGQLILDFKAVPAGRTLWMGGTDKVKEREVSNFNCSFKKINTVYDVVDAFWLLLNGSGVGFTPSPGSLNGFQKPIKNVRVIRSQRDPYEKGCPYNVETFEDGVWTIKVGDSGEAWAKSIGKLLVGKFATDTLVLDFSEIRGPGALLNGYGWISAGDTVISVEYPKIVKLLNKRAGRLLTHIDILDLLNHLGVIQTGRRGAELALYDYGNQQWEDFATAKANYWEKNPHRAQSNNSILFHNKPERQELEHIFDMMVASGGSEPGFINYKELKRRAPYAKGLNPCAEILLSDAGLCNLVELNVAAFDDMNEMLRAIYLIARANYRQTLVDLDDGILQRSWHENNSFLRLCGTSLTGIVMRPDLTPHDFKVLKNWAVHGSYSMAQELGTPYPKNTTTVKPSGTVSKVLNCTEGIHKPLGRYIFNNITFSKYDPLVDALRDAGYRIIDNPNQPDGVVVSFPISWETVPFTHTGEGLWINTESALTQLNRYKMIMNTYVEHNASNTISYSKDEIPEMIDWLLANWDSYVGVSFLFRADPTMTPEDLGHPYLPQEVVDTKRWYEYTQSLREVENIESMSNEVDDEGCVGGVCPVR